MFTIEISIT